MKTELNHETNKRDIYTVRFIRIGEKIFYEGSPMDESLNHDSLAIELGITERDSAGKLLVDDAGWIEPSETDKGNFIFTGKTESCSIKGDLAEARKITNKMAQKILGKNKVEI